MVLLSGNFRRLKVDVSRLCCCQIRFGTKYKPKFDTNQNLRIPLARFKTFTVLCPDYFSSIIIYCGHFIKHKLLIFEEGLCCSKNLFGYAIVCYLELLPLYYKICNSKQQTTFYLKTLISDGQVSFKF